MSLTVYKRGRGERREARQPGGSTTEAAGNASASAARYRFGPFALDGGRRTLLRDGVPCHLPPRVFTLAETLVARAGEAVSKEDLMEAVWPDVVVSEHSLSEAIWQLRRALGDNPKRPEYIQTVPKFGFRFVADVAREDSPLAAISNAGVWRVAAAITIAVAAGAFALIASLGPSETITTGGGAVLREMTLKSKEILEAHPLNVAKKAEGKPLANMIWPTYFPSLLPTSYTLAGAIFVVGGLLLVVTEKAHQADEEE